MLSKDDLIQALERIALLLELKGENTFKIRAYKSGAEKISAYSGDFMQMARDNRLQEIAGFGEALAKKLHELVTTGRMEYYENLKKEFPESLFELFDVQGLGAKRIKALHEQLQVGTLADLKRVCESGEAAKLSGFGAKTAEKILEALAFREQNAERFLLGDVAGLVETILANLRALPEVSQAAVAGSFRRAKETVHDLDFIVSTKNPPAVIAAFCSQPFVQSVIVQGGTKASVHGPGGLQCDLRVVSNEEYPFALNYFTGSKEHNVVMRGRARDLGFTLNEYRLAPLEESKQAPKNIHTEADLYRALGLGYIEPELRENAGEFEACLAGELPDLVKLENLRGTFHNHTTASDGKNSLAEMASAAEELGLEYLGIADHSKSEFQANGLKEDRLLAQIEEIRALNAAGGGVRVFSGTECDILKDGRLDFADDILSQLDYVVASVHGSFTLSEEEQTKRIIRAVESPYVTMLGHLTGRLLLRREGYAVNVPKIIDACAATGTWIELNANPWRLDMDWRWWRLARDKGVKCAINPDAHSTAGLQDLHFGVCLARKGWLRREDVVNCMPRAAMEVALKQKRLG